MSFVNGLCTNIIFTEKEALKFIFPKAEEIKIEKYFLTRHQKKILRKKWRVKFYPKYNRDFKFYVGISSQNIIGYGYIDTVKGKWGRIIYIVKISTAGKIENLTIMSHIERIGVQIQERKFLEQYIGKSLSDPLKIHKDIDAVTGATISSRSITQGIKKVLILFNEFYSARYIREKRSNGY